MTMYRQLTITEQERLVRNGCRCSDWTLVKVKDGFNPDRYIRVSFSGEVLLGVAVRKLTDSTGLELESGIYDAEISNCSIGDNVRISRVNGCLSNYNIGDGCLISNIGTMAATPGAMFGNGVHVNVLNETGGRTNIIYDRLSAQIAYMMTFYRHDDEFIHRLTSIIERYAESRRADTGTVGHDTTIANCPTIINVRIGSNATINGASRLNDGTVGDYASVGSAVIAEHFIMQSQAVVDNASILINSFVGQASRLSNCFVAHDSLFFANCTMECGEAVSIFAGPHTVSMHKSSLLIGGYFSFFNAGSGTNQSNHLYKLGPMHQGVTARGCKTASNTYIMWPARFGGFSMISGGHYSHPDTSVLPYSYVLAHDGKTKVIPGSNLKTMGTIRDLLKWGRRDRRLPGIEKLDLINYDNLSPVTTDGMYGAISFLNSLEYDHKLTEALRFEVEYASIKKGKEYYALGVEYFMGEAIVQHLFDLNPSPDTSLSDQLSSSKEASYLKWVDLAGMIAPQDLIVDVCAKISDGSINDIESVEQALNDIYLRYRDLKWAYVLSKIDTCYSISPDDLTPEVVISIIDRWRDSVVALDRLRKDDALKDFSEPMTTGFGIDGDETCRSDDFRNVNGNPEEHEVIASVHKHYTDALLDAHEMTARIKKTFAITD